MKRALILVTISIIGLLAACGPGPIHVILKFSADTFTVDDQGNRDLDKEDKRIQFSMTLNGQVDGKPGIKAENGQPLPWTKPNTFTPRREDIFISRNARTWFVTMTGVYKVNNLANIPYTVLRCEIWVDGHVVKTEHAVVRRNATTLSCHYARG